MSTVPSKVWMGVALPLFGSLRRAFIGVLGKCRSKNCRLMIVQGDFMSTSAQSGTDLPARFMMYTVPRRGLQEGVVLVS